MYMGYKDYLKELTDCTPNDCGIKAVQNITKKPYKQIVKKAGNAYNTKDGMKAFMIELLLSSMGIKFISNRQDLIGKTLYQTQTILKEEPNVKILASIKVRGAEHAVTFVDDKWHNTFEQYRNKITYATEWK